ncbi:MAG TPA: LssY C-terminal domain-containing protein [Terrimicrobiaceae bacterium]
MSQESESKAPAGNVAEARRRRWRLAAWKLILWLLVAWAAAAYLLVPWLWKIYFRHHRALTGVDRVTHTGDGHPGDPVNISVAGTETQVIQAMIAAGWYPADPITFRSSVRIAVDSVFRRPDDEAPVSSLYLFGRKQDLAFEQPVGNSPRQRHHVRFWHSEERESGRPMWLGAATFDERVGLSYTTGEVTHHIGPNVDAERDRIANELEKVDRVQEVYWINDFHPRLEGRNGGGDPWHTDGRLAVVVLKDRSDVPPQEKR